MKTCPKPTHLISLTPPSTIFSFLTSPLSSLLSHFSLPTSYLSFFIFLLSSSFLILSSSFFPPQVFAQSACCNDNCACACWGGGTDKNWYCQTCWNGGSVGYFDVTTNSCQFKTSLEYQSVPAYSPSCTGAEQVATLAKPCCPGLTRCPDDFCRTACPTSAQNYCFDANNFCQAKQAASCQTNLGLYPDSGSCWDHIESNSSPCYTIIPGNICQSAKPQYCYFSRNFSSQADCLRYFQTQSPSSNDLRPHGTSCSANSQCQSGYCSPQTNRCGPRQTTCFDRNSSPPCASITAVDCTPDHLFSTQASCRFALTQSTLIDCFTPESNCSPQDTVRASSCDPGNNLYTDQASCLDSLSQSDTCLDVTYGCLAIASYPSCNSPNLFLPDQLDSCLSEWNQRFSTLSDGLCTQIGTTCISPTLQASCTTLNSPPTNEKSCRPLSCDPNSGYCTCWVPLDTGCVYTSGEICDLGYSAKAECQTVFNQAMENSELQETLAALACDDESLYFCDSNGAAHTCIDKLWQIDPSKDTLCCTLPGEKRCIDIGDSSFIQTCTDANNWQITNQTASCGNTATKAAESINSVLKYLAKPFSTNPDKPGRLAFVSRFFQRFSKTKPQDANPPSAQELELTKQLGAYVQSATDQLEDCYLTSPTYCDAIAEVNLHLFQLQTAHYKDVCLADQLSNATCQSILNQLATSISHLLQSVPQPKPLPWFRRLQLALPFI